MKALLIDPATRALADLTRLRIMRLIATMELAVGELAQVLGQSQPRVSRHIRILAEAGLAERRKEGSWMFIRNALPAGAGAGLRGAIAALLAAAEAEDAGFAQCCAEDRRRLAAVRRDREAAAASYFARHAEQWDELSALHSPAVAIEAALLEALGPAGLGSLLDIGTGTGRIAEVLAPHAEAVTGLDNSPEMLRIARARLQHLPAARLALVQGDFLALPFPDAAFDTVLFHQVLHYAQAPQAALAEAARVVRPGGRIAIVDFAAHDREELRAVHAHARLGFDDPQMEALLASAGFAPTRTLALPPAPADELTVKIWTATRRGALRAVSAPPARKMTA